MSLSHLEQETSHSAAYKTAGEAIMSFGPINQIHQHLCGLHVYAHDPSRAVKAHHFCTHLRKGMHQCVIYDSDQADARLIGIEYIIQEEEFQRLSDVEKRFWHSHKYEVESGMLALITKALVPASLTDAAERPAMRELHRTYGKTIHTWQFDIHADLPLGPPQLMLAYTADIQVDQEMLAQRDADYGISTLANAQRRQDYLRSEDMERSPVAGGDIIWHEGKRYQLRLEPLDE